MYSEGQNKVSTTIRIKRLENQLLTGYKTVANNDGSIGTVQLTEEEISEIKKEIESLKNLNYLK